MKCLVSVRSSVWVPPSQRIIRPGHLLTVGDEAAKVPANNAMPCCTLPLVELEDVSIRCSLLDMLQRTVRLMWWAISCGCVSHNHPGVVCLFTCGDTNLLNCVLLHGFLGCWRISDSFARVTPVSNGHVPTSIASCCMSSL
jgi:hypothetical protein